MGILTRRFPRSLPFLRGSQQPQGSAGPKPTPNGQRVATKPPVVVVVHAAGEGTQWAS